MIKAVYGNFNYAALELRLIKAYSEQDAEFAMKMYGELDEKSEQEVRDLIDETQQAPWARKL
jgi:hypothetical protein